jgi:3-deoxy-D-manno-octulosonic-acid transferase
VSVGEVSALRSLVPMLCAEADVVVSTTTDTGMARARELYGASCEVVRYPLDFSWAVARFLDAVRPDVVALVELEVWPNFVDACAARGVPACIINGRLSERSFKGYSRIRGFFGRRLRKLACAAVQDIEYAGRFEALGMEPYRVLVSGSMKWDSATIEDAASVAGSAELARDMGIDRGKPLVVAGSTAEDEEALLHAACGACVQLLCAPRKPEHFEEAAAALPGCVRRSEQLAGKPTGRAESGRFLLDTIGELRKAYALADVVVMGRSFGGLFGSDPIEPIALGKPTLIGPSHGDFVGAVRALTEGAGVGVSGLQVVKREELAASIARLCGDERERAARGEAGRARIRAEQGASTRHAELVLSLVRG